MDFNALLAEKKKKANEQQNQKPFAKQKMGSNNNTQRQMPMRKTGRGK